MKKNNKGFSLVELIVVIAIMAILAAIAIPTFAHFINKANEAADDQLLHDINYIFQAACLENGVDINDVTAAEITYSPDEGTPIALTSVTVNGTSDPTLSADIVASFTLHFSDMKNEKFKIIENIAFDADAHAFVEADSDSITVNYGGTTITLSAADIQKIKDSAFKDIGAENLLAMVDMATGLINFDDPNASLTQLANSTGAKTFLYEKLGVSNDEEIYGLLVAQYPQGEMTDDEYSAFLDVKFNEVVANNAVLYAAQNSESASKGIWDVLRAEDVKETIKSNQNTDEQLAQSAMAFAMYSAYTGTDSLENVSLTDVYDTLNSQEFKEYLDDPQAQKDLDGYLASMNVVNDGVSSGSGAAQNVLLNGFSDEELADLMSGLIGN